MENFHVCVPSVFLGSLSEHASRRISIGICDCCCPAPRLLCAASCPRHYWYLVMKFPGSTCLCAEHIICRAAAAVGRRPGRARCTSHSSLHTIWCLGSHGRAGKAKISTASGRRGVNDSNQGWCLPACHAGFALEPAAVASQSRTICGLSQAGVVTSTISCSSAAELQLP